jgi:hypothetical protein
MDMSEFCRSRGLSQSTLYRHLKNRPNEGNRGSGGIELLAQYAASVHG